MIVRGFGFEDTNSDSLIFVLLTMQLMNDINCTLLLMRPEVRMEVTRLPFYIINSKIVMAMPAVAY